LFAMQQIAPVVAGALIVAGTSLLSGIMGSASEAQRRKQEMLMQANQQNFDARSKSAENMGKNQQNAFAQLMDTYKNALL
jgi:Sec-independent protein translocase protein TatA